MTSPQPTDPAVCRHRLGARLRELRQARGLRMDESAAALGVVPSTLSRIETGKAPARAGYVRVLLDLYGLDDHGQRQALAGLAAHGRQDNWCAGAADLLSPVAIRYLGLETAAACIRQFAASVIPGLLQTPGYAIAAWQAARPGLTPAQADRLAVITIGRHKNLAPHTALHVVIDETALRRPVGTACIMADQLDHLAAAAGDASVTVQVLPLAVPWPVLSPPFTLLTFDTDPDAACAPDPAGRPALITAPRAVGARRAAFDALTAAALPPAQSAALISRLAEHMCPCPPPGKGSHHAAA